jgi:hypothetical protein
MSKSLNNGRELVRALGIGNFNATMIIQYLFIAPATTDPKSAPVIMLVKAIQKKLIAMGAKIAPTGYLDNATAAAIEVICGHGWEQRPWADLVQNVLQAQRTGATWRDEPELVPNYGPSKMQLGFVSLPDVPGGFVTYGLAAVVAYHLWKKRKR